MLKIEYIWRELLYKTIERNNPFFTISALAHQFSLSTSLVNHALIPLKNLHIVQINKTKSRVINWEKLLFFWATRRNLKKDIIYSTYSNLSPYQREGLMPPDVIPTTYTAFRRIFKTIPADYDHIYFYASDIKEVIKRFPQSKKNPNIFILRTDPYLLHEKKITLGQLFVDLWNLPDWYAKDFIDKLLLKIQQIAS